MHLFSLSSPRRRFFPPSMHKIVIYTDKETKEGDLVIAMTAGNMTHSYPPVCKAELTLIF